MNELTNRMADLHTDLKAKQRLDWPLTFRGQDRVFVLAQQMLNDAQAYLMVGQEDGAALSLQVTEDCLRILTSLFALATEDI